MNTRKIQVTLFILMAATLISTAAYAYVGQGRLKADNTGADIKETEVIETDAKDTDVKEATEKETVNVEESAPRTEIKSETRDNSATNRSANIDKSLARILVVKNIPTPITDLKIVVDKTDNVLTLYSGSTALKSYHAAIGEGGLGDKERSGDHKTPEGTFYISEKLVLSPADKILGTRWMRVSYPNVEDAERGLQTGLIDQATYDQIVQANKNGTTPPQKTSLGGGVGIHGGSGYPGNQGNYWTWGCVGLNDKDVEEIYEYIQVGTLLIIQK